MATDEYTVVVPHIEMITIIPANTKAGRFQAEAKAHFSNGEVETVLSWYNDELTFVESDFIGKTKREVTDMFFERDRQYLQS